MNRLGDTEPNKAIIGTIIAVVVLVVVLFFASDAFGSVTRYVSLFIPGFDQNVSVEDDELILRYDIVNEQIQYYTGSEFVEIKEGIKFNDKQISEAFLEQEFDDFWLGRGDYGDVREKYFSEVLSVSASNQLYSDSGVPFLGIVIKDIVNIDLRDIGEDNYVFGYIVSAGLVTDLRSSSEEQKEQIVGTLSTVRNDKFKSYGNFVVKLNGDVEVNLLRNPSNQGSGLSGYKAVGGTVSSEISEFAASWRDNFNQGIMIDGREYSVEKINNYLVARL